MVWSRIGNTEIIIGVCIIMVGLIWWLTKQWWVAVIPAIAISDPGHGVRHRDRGDRP